METLRQIFIVPDENKVDISCYVGNLENKDDSHIRVVKEFAEKYDRGIIERVTTFKNDNSLDISWFIESAKSGHLVIQRDDGIIFYLPPVITKHQYEYIKENKNHFYGSNIHITSIYKENDEYYSVNFDDEIELSLNEVDILMAECKKKYIPQNNSYVMIIPNENDIVIDQGYFIKKFDSNILDGHGEVFKVFCMSHLLPVYIPDKGGYYWGKELATKGIFSIQKEDDEIYLFVPNRLSNNQIEWFDKNREYLSEFKFLEAGVWLDDGSYREVFKYEENGKEKSTVELVNEIYGIVEEKKNKNRSK